MTCFTLWGTASEWPKKSQIWSGSLKKLVVCYIENCTFSQMTVNLVARHISMFCHEEWKYSCLMCPNFTGLMKAQPWTDLDDTPVLNLSYHYRVRTGAAASSCIQGASWCFPNWASGHFLYLIPFFACVFFSGPGGYGHFAPFTGSHMNVGAVVLEAWVPRSAVQCHRLILLAMVDSIQPWFSWGLFLEVKWVGIRCVPGDIHKYPLVPVEDSWEVWAAAVLLGIPFFSSDSWLSSKM